MTAPRISEYLVRANSGRNRPKTILANLTRARTIRPQQVSHPQSQKWRSSTPHYFLLPAANSCGRRAWLRRSCAEEQQPSAYPAKEALCDDIAVNGQYTTCSLKPWSKPRSGGPYDPWHKVLESLPSLGKVPAHAQFLMEERGKLSALQKDKGR